MILALLACIHPHRPVEAASPGESGPVLHCVAQDWPAAIRGSLEAEQQRGLLLAARDRLAWEATDRAVEAVGDLGAAMQRWGASGYIIDGTSTTDGVVHVVGPRGADVMEVAVTRFDPAHPGGVFELLAAPLPADPSVTARFHAMDLVRGDSRFVPKAASYNLDVVQWSADPGDGWAVYAVPGATDFAAVPLGGGYRAHASVDGRSISEFLAISKGVLTVPVSQLESGELAAFTTTIFTTIPDATYFAFANIWKVPLFVVNMDGDIFAIAGARVCWGRLDPSE